MPVRRKHIREFAHRLLEKYGIDSPPVPIEDVARSLGACIKYEPAEDNLSGFLFRNCQRTTVIGVNNLHPATRQRFTVAHELGHHLLHECDVVHVDRVFQVKLRNDDSSKGTDLEEKEANLFAAEILMPVDFVREDLEKLGEVDLDNPAELAHLAQRYGVSSQALTFRLAYLGYIQL